MQTVEQFPAGMATLLSTCHESAKILWRLLSSVPIENSSSVEQVARGRIKKTPNGLMQGCRMSNVEVEAARGIAAEIVCTVME